MLLGRKKGTESVQVMRTGLFGVLMKTNSGTR